MTSEFNPPSTTSKFIAELIGTLVLVFFGCGAVVTSGLDGTTGVGILGVAFAFGISVIAMVYTVGHISGGHLNPAITLGMVFAGRMKTQEGILYIIAQVIGAIIAAGLLYFIATGKPGYDISINGLGQNGYGENSLHKYSMMAGFTAEVILTFVFVLTVLGSTASKNLNVGFAGVAIGLCLTMIHIVGIPVTGVSVNPARSIGPALFVGGAALSQLWLFLIAPIIGAAIAVLVWKLGLDKY